MYQIPRPPDMLICDSGGIPPHAHPGFIEFSGGVFVSDNTPPLGLESGGQVPLISVPDSLFDDEFSAIFDVDAVGGGCYTASLEVVDGIVVGGCRFLDVADGGMVEDILNALCRIDFSIAPADGVVSGEFVVDRCFAQHFLHIVQRKGGICL